ncbi:MAG: tRNA uridine-5-carboxymethylaminomethyl(34) synthesis GTPase MnmE [Bacteroidia bacterium]|nr:tRNA uridine-5-carboxymethylaminomethyl(34) synthesis GTPase MnmE [Bacteroidia bacterium]
MSTEETICAPATSGGGAIAIIRISGRQSIGICNKIFFPFDRKINLDKQNGYSIIYGEILSGGEIIDDVLVSIFRSPHSYTGEDSIEISCHASGYIQKKILELLVENGAVTAQPGEFTRRAFMNGKMDLSQAEAVADLIAAESGQAHRIAMSQMRGSFSDEISALRADLLHFASLIELELDFGEEDVEFADRKELKSLVNKVLAVAKGLSSSFSIGNVIKHGVPVTITGAPNTGKSTLLNTLLNEEKAIVSELPGTTRDFIEDTVIIDGIQYRFVDTAGLRKSDDVIEKLGIKRTFEKIEQASIILLVADIREGMQALMKTLTDLRREIAGKGKKLVILVNKTDTDDGSKRKDIEGKIDLEENESILFISAKTGSGVNELKMTLTRISGVGHILTEGVIISNIRHYEALLKVTESLERVLAGLENKIPEDLIAIDVRQAIHYLGEITGEITTDEILGNIFKNFCIGK